MRCPPDVFDAEAEAHVLFAAALTAAGLAFVREGDLYRLAARAGAGETTVSLANAVRDYARERDPAVIATFAARVGEVARPGANSIGDPTWAEVEHRVYWMLEATTTDPGDTLGAPLSPALRRALVWTSPDEDFYAFITPAQRDRWGIDDAALRARADRNQDALLAGKACATDELVTEAGARVAIGMIPVATGLKASTILAPSFKAFAQGAVGWPLYAVVPCRDFCLLVGAAAADATPEVFDRLGAITVREFTGSGYPLAPELLRLDDDGIRAVGAFGPVDDGDDGDDGDDA
ncbi:MAG: hypothetical protein KBG28_17210 [Kofleriaceae bacterium]|nr:hypothetical protein [Kofleriaceae bacterium]